MGGLRERGTLNEYEKALAALNVQLPPVTMAQVRQAAMLHYGSTM